MSSIPDADLAELAFAVANGEALPPDKAELARRIGLSQADAPPALDDYLRVIGLLKSARGCPDQERTAECLDDARLAGYLDGTLDAGARAAAEDHLGRCDHCLSQLAGLADALAELRIDGAYDADDIERPAPPSLFEYVVEIARAVRGAAKGLRLLTHPEEGFTLLEPHPVPVLGPAAPGTAGEIAHALAQDTCAWIQFFHGCDLAFTLVRLDDAGAGGRGRVNACLTLSASSRPVPGARLTLRREGRILQSECFSETGSLSLLNLDAGIYECELDLPSLEKVHFTLNLRESA